MNIEFVGAKGHGADNNFGIPFRRDRNLAAKFITLMFFVLAHAVDMRFVQAIQLFLVTALLVQSTME